MPQVVNILTSTGIPPYDIYVCDITNTYCFSVSAATTITPIQIFNVPPPLDNVDYLLLKIIDSSSCEKFIYLECTIDNKIFEDGFSFIFMDGPEYIFEG
jgi:hypothetical protein